MTNPDILANLTMIVLTIIMFVFLLNHLTILLALAKVLLAFAFFVNIAVISWLINYHI